MLDSRTEHAWEKRLLMECGHWSGTVSGDKYVFNSGFQMICLGEVQRLTGFKKETFI